jgi:thiol-disulfide isomerase/thioredoxin
MTRRAAVAAGLASGVVTAVALIVGVALLVPPPATGPGPSASTAPDGSIPPDGSAGPSASAGPSGSAAPLFHVGEPAPTFVVPQLGGGEIDLAALRGRPVWLNIMATWCPECRDEFPLMSGFAARYAEHDLVVLAIDTREDEATVAAFVATVTTAFPVGLDLDGSVADAWDALVLPVHYWIDREGIIRAGAVGGLGPDLMAAQMQLILPEVAVEP